MSDYTLKPAFCDWLDCTMPPDSLDWLSVSDLLGSVGGLSKRLNSGAVEVRFGPGTWGNVQYSQRGQSWSRISASGTALEHLRASNAFGEYLSLLGAVPHRVTRLDASLDIPVDGAKVLQRLRWRYSKGKKVSLSRKPLKPTWLMSPRDSDSHLTGTMYVGRNSRARISARVYDKAQEQLDKYGREIPPLTRYEVTFRADTGVTLRDAHDPTPLFYSYAVPSLLQVNPSVTLPTWEPYEGEHWCSTTPTKSPLDRLRSRVSYSTELDELVELADLCGPSGRLQLLREFRSKLGLLEVAIPNVA